MSELPSYYHLSKSQIKQLGFHVNLRCVRKGGNSVVVRGGSERVFREDEAANIGPLMSMDIGWQEKVPGPADGVGGNDGNGGVFIFTHTSGDNLPSGVLSARDPIRPIQSSFFQRYQPFKPMRVEQSRISQHTELNDRLQRENQYQIMVIMAAVFSESSRKIHEEILCVIKVYQSGLVSACPGWSEEEPEDCDDSRIFASDKAINYVIENGPLLTTYAFTTPEGSVYQYTIERIGEISLCDDAEEMIARQEQLNREADEERRETIQKEFDSSFYMFDKDANWDYQAHVEIISASGFIGSNHLFSFPFGSNVVIRYKVFAPSSTAEMQVISKGITNKAQTKALIRSLEFFTLFTVALVGLSFAAFLAWGDVGIEFSRTLVLVAVPLVLMFKSVVFGDEALYHFNQRFSLLYKGDHDSQIPEPKNEGGKASKQQLKLELHAYFKHNVGLVSLAGCGSVSLPSEPGHYNIEVPTWKPIAYTSMSETRCRMHDYFLGACLDEIGPSDPVAISEQEDEWTKGSDIKFFSKGGLRTDGSGTIWIRVDITENFFKNGLNYGLNSLSEESESQQQRIHIRETVDEVLTRVRKNKRERMTREHGSGNHEKAGSPNDRASRVRWKDDNTGLDRGKGSESNDRKLSDRTSEVLERVRSRQNPERTESIQKDYYNAMR